MPSSAERRRVDRRASKATVADYSGPERREHTDRRRRGGKGSLALPTGFENGWLCFECTDGEKRRLVPVPEDWDAAPIEALRKFLDAATRVVRCGVR